MTNLRDDFNSGARAARATRSRNTRAASPGCRTSETGITSSTGRRRRATREHAAACVWTWASGTPTGRRSIGRRISDSRAEGAHQRAGRRRDVAFTATAPLKCPSALCASPRSEKYWAARAWALRRDSGRARVPARLHRATSPARRRAGAGRTHAWPTCARSLRIDWISACTPHAMET
jgi:hypothetical protein